MDDPRRLPVAVSVERGQLRLSSGRNELGDWPMSRVRIEEHSATSVKLHADDAELILFLDQHRQFLSETEHYRRSTSDRRRPDPLAPQAPAGPTLGEELKSEVSQEVAPIIDEARRMLDLIPRGRTGWIALAVLVVLVIVIPSVVVGIALVGGILTLLIGGLAYVETRIADKIPDPLTPATLVVLGVVLVVSGIIIGFIRSLV